MKRLVSLASLATALVLGWAPTIVRADPPLCNLPHTESMGIVSEDGSNIPATSEGSYYCPQESALPPTLSPPPVMMAPAGPDLRMAMRRELPDVFFEPGSALLTNTAITQIDYFTYYDVITTPTQSIRITGYADERATAAANQALAARRAMAVADYMATKGVPRGRMVVMGAAGVPDRNGGRVDVVAE